MNKIDLYQKLGFIGGDIPLSLLRQIIASRPNEIIVNDTGIGKRNIKVTFKLKKKCINLVNKDEMDKKDNT